MRCGRFMTTVCAIATLAPVTALAGSDVGRSTTTDGPVWLSVSVDRVDAQVADPIQLVVEVSAPRGTKVQLPQLPGELGEFDVHAIREMKDVPSGEDADTRRWILRATLETIKTGDRTIPALEVHYATDATAKTFKTLRSRPIAVRIASVLENRADPTKFRDIKDTVDLAVPAVHGRAWIGWTTAGVGAVALLALLTVAVVKRNRGPSPAAWALSQIADLERAPISDPAEAEAIYNELVDIVREYFELEFNVPTLTRTTREFLVQAAKSVGMEETARKRLALLASMADEIKFACRGVGEQQVCQAFESAKVFVHECEQHRLAIDKEGP